MPSVKARHILVSSNEQCLEIRKKIEEGADFATLAIRYSECPSAADGGDLGEVEPGKMGSEVDKVLFNDENIDVVKGPVKTEFGYHLFKVTARTP
jgi:peptidyl-prolyl cis-trans isomerase C